MYLGFFGEGFIWEIIACHAWSLRAVMAAAFLVLGISSFINLQRIN